MRPTNHLINADRLSQALTQITKTPALTGGILQEAAEVIAKEGCLAMDSTQISIWQVNYEKEQLEGITCYNAETRGYNLQEPFPFDDKPHYINLLQSERFILINDAEKDILLPSLQEVYGPDFRALLDAPIRVGGKLVGVVCIEQFYTTRYWTTAEQTFAGSLADFMALAMESSERHQAMQELAQSKRLTETLMSNLPGMVYQCLNDPPDYTFLFVSEGCLPLTGYTPEELMKNRALKFFDMVHPEDLEVLEAANKATLSVGLPLEISFRLIMKDRSIKWVWERSRVVEFNKDGTPYLLEGFYTDITEQRRMEAATLANKAKNEFLAKISHEIRTPMNVVHSLTDLALRQHPSENTFDYLLNIKAAANSLLTITNDLLDFSKTDTRADELTSEPYSVSSFINDIVMLAHVRIGAKPIELIVEDCPDLPRTLIGDGPRLQQGISHLLDNAIKSTSEGEILFFLEAKPTNDPKVMLIKGSITNTGTGIVEESQAELPDRFFQQDTKEKGAGPDLAIAKNLMELMGGTISVLDMDNQSTQVLFEVVHTVADARPNVQKMESSRRVGIWLKNSPKAESLLRKLTSLGFYASIADGPESFTGYTDVFFDHSNLSHLLTDEFSHIRLIGLSKNYTDNRSLPSNIQMMCSPLTSLLTTQLLSGEPEAPLGSKLKMARNFLWLHGAKILIVDDNDTNLIITQEVLENYGAVVDKATSGKLALKMVTEKEYHLVFMDHMMPEMDGAEATSLIRKMPEERFQKLPIVALTANAVGNVWDLFMANGMNDFLAKPLNTKELERVLCTWLPKDKWTRGE